MSLPRYEEYKDSGVDWIGSVPTHWKVEPVKRGFSVVGGSTPKSDEAAFWDGEIVWVSPADLSRLPSMYIAGSGRTITKAGLRSCGTTLVPPGSIVLSTRAPIGSLAIAATTLCTNQGCKSLVPSKLESSHYFAYVLLSATGPLNLRGKGTTFLELSADELAAFRVPYPTPMEQTAIAAFLDRETTKIDELIAEQEKLISLLVEKRRATISHVVTKGLDSDARMKDSNVTWMGEVPAHWPIAKLGLYATVENGTTPSRAAPEYWDGGDIPWLASGEVNQLKITEASEFITAAALKSCSLRLLPAGAVVVGMIGQGKTRGMSAILSIPATINQNLAAICPGSRIEGMYILYLLHAVYEWLREAGRGGNQAAMNCEILAALRIPLPPLAEQKVIVDFIEVEAAKLDSLKARAEHAIALLKERRGALITAAVTGQIDVRGAMAQNIVESPEAIAA